ncbi:GntR family transcriptional regulator [Nonomuraea ferruginea]
MLHAGATGSRTRLQVAASGRRLPGDPGRDRRRHAGPPGERLNDTDLVEWLGVSRTPVREALARLEQAGLVRTKPGRYTIVSPLDARACRDAQSVTAAMHELAVREALPNLSATELEAMRTANARFADALRRDDVDAALAADDEFHGVLVTASANDALRDVLERFTPVLRRLERLRFSSLSGRESVAQHDRIIELCAAERRGGGGRGHPRQLGDAHPVARRTARHRGQFAMISGLIASA